MKEIEKIEASIYLYDCLKEVLPEYAVKFMKELNNKLEDSYKILDFDEDEIREIYTNSNFTPGIYLELDNHCIGDIHVGGDETQVIFHEKIYLFLRNNFTQIRGKRIVPSFYPSPEIRAYAPKFEEKIITVSSPRIDAVIDRIWGISRQGAAEAIHQKRLWVNYREIRKKDLTVKPGDIISFRGKGKAKVSDFVGVSKKGKQRIKIERYI